MVTDGRTRRATARGSKLRPMRRRGAPQGSPRVVVDDLEARKDGEEDDVIGEEEVRDGARRHDLDTVRPAATCTGESTEMSSKNTSASARSMASTGDGGIAHRSCGPRWNRGAPSRRAATAARSGREGNGARVPPGGAGYIGGSSPTTSTPSCPRGRLL